MLSRVGLLMTLLSFGLCTTFTEVQFIQQVIDQNLDLELARQDLKLSKVYQNEARSTALPKVMVESNFTRNLDIPNMYFDPEFGELMGDTTGNPVAIPMGYKNDYGLNAVLNQTLFDANASFARRAAKEFRVLSENIFSASENAIATYARKAFYQTLLVKKVWEVSVQAEQNASENYVQTRTKFHAGLVSEFELLQAEVRWQNQIPQTMQHHRNYELALNMLKKMANIPDDLLEISGGFETYPPIPGELSLSTILNDRPDYNAQVWERELRTTNLKSKYASFIPTLSMNAIWSFSGSSDDFEIENDNNLKMIGLNLSWPVWLGGYNQAQVSKAKIELRKSTLQTTQTKQDIQIEISNIYLRMDEALLRIQAAESTLLTAAKAFEIAESSAASGLATQLELRESRTGYDQAQLNYYGAVFDYLDAYFDWELATGNVKL